MNGNEAEFKALLGEGVYHLLKQEVNLTENEKAKEVLVEAMEKRMDEIIEEVTTDLIKKM